MYLQQEDIIIRTVTDDDVFYLVKWWNDGCVMEHAGFYDGIDTTCQRVYCQIQDEMDEKEKLRLIIEINKNPVGEMVYKVQNNDVEIGIKICERNYQNHGYGQKILIMFFDELFSRGYKNILISTLKRNKRARYVYKKLGAKIQKIEYKSYKDSYGEMLDCIFYILNSEEFYRNIKIEKNF